MATVHLTAEEIVERLQERLGDILRLQQRAYLKEAAALLDACEKHEVDGAVWDRADRLTDTVNHIGGFIADAEKLLAALGCWVREGEAE